MYNTKVLLLPLYQSVMIWILNIMTIIISFSLNSPSMSLHFYNVFFLLMARTMIYISILLSTNSLYTTFSTRILWKSGPLLLFHVFFSYLSLADLNCLYITDVISLARWMMTHSNNLINYKTISIIHAPCSHPKTIYRILHSAVFSLCPYVYEQYHRNFHLYTNYCVLKSLHAYHLQTWLPCFPYLTH